MCASKSILKIKYCTPEDREFFALFAHYLSMVSCLFVQENKNCELTPDGIYGNLRFHKLDLSCKILILVPSDVELNSE